MSCHAHFQYVGVDICDTSNARLKYKFGIMSKIYSMCI